MPEESLSQQEFHDTVISSFAELKTTTTVIVEQLKKLNGTVLGHTEKISNLSHELEMHPLTCPLKAQFGELSLTITQQTTAKDASARTSKKWWENLKVPFYTIAGAIIYVILTHLEDLLKKF